MSFVETRETQRQTITGMKSTRVYVCRCDTCNSELIRDRHAKQVNHHYCNRDCLKKGFSRNGASGTAMVIANLKKYGCENVFAVPSVKDKIDETMMSKYGVKRPAQNASLMEKQCNTTRERYGVNSVLSLRDVHDKGISIAATAEVRAKIDWQVANAKRHQTNKRNGTYLSSKIEARFYNHLVERFGEVQRAVEVNGWEIDFYVPLISTHIQFDGVYWHGLDRPLDVIREFKSPRDKVIYMTYCRDRAQDEWFAANHLQLQRVTDLQFKRGDHVSFT